MNIHTFLEHHGIRRNPFAEEDAQTDNVFRDHCIASAYHPIWDKVYGDPRNPATSIVFGPKGSGKTAMRLQIARHMERFNDDHPGDGVYLIRYDDFNPFLDQFGERMSSRTNRKPERVLDSWRLWDHMDAILCLGVTDLVGRIVSGDPTVDRDAVRRLDRTSSRDLLMLAAAYDQSTESSFTSRWSKLRRRLHYSNFGTKWPKLLAILSLLASIALVAFLLLRDTGVAPDAPAVANDVMRTEDGVTSPHVLWLIPIITLIGSLPWLIRWGKTQWAAHQIHKHMKVGKRETGEIRKALMAIPPKELASQPLPRYERTDDRYELLHKFQAVLKRLGFGGVVVLMDQVDEPHLIGGKPELMRRFVWPMLDNKLLKHQGIGFKLFLPQELYRDIERETREFHERARIDKQNVIPSFRWTGEAMYDLARARMMACAEEGRSPEPKQMFEGIEYSRMLSAFESLRVPRHLFRFLYRVLVEHCNRHTDDRPDYTVDAQTFESQLAVYQRETDAAGVA